MELKFTVQARIQKPVAEVFDAVYNPSKISKYFATGSASGPLDEGARVMWKFADFPDVEAPVEVKKMIPQKLIAFEWESAEGGYNTRVEMQFEALSANETLVKISESGWRDTPKGLETSYGNCEGWTFMAAALKLFVERGINLRDGFYGPRQ
jgi:uncharacterized protein YndB with AHSA1/START domain